MDEPIIDNGVAILPDPPTSPPPLPSRGDLVQATLAYPDGRWESVRGVVTFAHPLCVLMAVRTKAGERNCYYASAVVLQRASER